MPGATLLSSHKPTLRCRADLRRNADMPGTERVEITGPYGDRYDEILTPQAIDLIAALHAELGPRRSELLAAPRRRQAELSGGPMLDFLPGTAEIPADARCPIPEPAPS